MTRAMSDFVVKRIFDLALASVLIVILIPLMVVIGIALLFSQGAPVIFAQMRPGLSAQPFKILKFRTMRNAFDKAGKPLPDEQRLTRSGKFLRATSLDELPELLNIVMGDMSFVGPRPLLMDYLPRYSNFQRRRHEVRPGITGLAQVNGRNALSWEERFRYDVHYVDHWSFGLDLRILAQTLWTVLKREGITQPGHATMGEFLGTPPGD